LVEDSGASRGTGLASRRNIKVAPVPKFDWIVGVAAMTIAGYESMSLIGGVAESLSARREPGVERFRLDIQEPRDDVGSSLEDVRARLGITRISETEYAVASRTNSYSCEGALGAKIERSFRNGEIDGFRFARSAPDSVYAALGFRSGDFVHYISGFATTDPDAALTVSQHLRGVAYVDVEFERAGTTLTRRYWLR